MLNADQAAKYLVVAWVKGWPMRTLLDTLDGTATGPVTDERLAVVAQAHPFMPTEMHWYISNRGSGVAARHFIADAFPRLNEALWSADDNAKRLRLASEIQKLRAGAVRASSRFSREESAEHRAVKKAERQATTSYHASRDAFRTHQGAAWNVCK